MSRCSFTLMQVVVAAVCIQLCQAHDFIGHCSCPNTIKLIKGNISDFRVLEERPQCAVTELIVTMDRPNSSPQEICINTEGKMGKAFLRCWRRINKDDSRKMECIRRKMKAA